MVRLGAWLHRNTNAAVAVMEMRRLIGLIEGEVLNELAFEEYQGAVHFTDWSEFKARLDQVAQSGFSSEQDLVEKMGFDYSVYDRCVDLAIGAWRDSTSTSLLHGTAHIGLTIPQAGQQIFPNLFWQTRFLTVLREKLRSFLPTPIRKPIRDGGETVRIAGYPALTVPTANLEKLNRILQMFYLYNFHTQHKGQGLKLPKFIYRGIRSGDLLGHDSLKPLVDHIWKTDQSHEMKRKQATDILIDYIIEHGLSKIADGKLLSFSATIPVAKYFTNGNGFVLRVDPKRVEIVTSEIHDPDRIGGKDFMSNKNEREYIIRVPEHYPWTREDVIMNDLDYFLAEVNPLCVGLFTHNDREASYAMNGVEIKARFQWNSQGTNGSVRFNYSTRSEFKKDHGFDPMPTEANLGEITDFKVYRVKSW